MRKIFALLTLAILTACNDHSIDGTSGIVGSGPNTVYVSSYSGTVYVCSLNSNGSFNACTSTPASGAPSGWRPNDVTLATVNGVKYAYVAAENAHFFYCTLNPDGTFNACASTPASGGPSWNTPWATTFATVNDVQYAYVTDEGAHHLYQCTLNPDGSFNACAITPASGAPSWAPGKIVFNTINSVQYAYVGDALGEKIYQCTLNSDGSFNTCTATPSSPPAWGLYGTASFNTFDGQPYAYVADSSNGAIYRCVLNTNGTLSGCATTPTSGTPGGWDPMNVIFTTINGTQYAYIADYNSNIISQCPMNSDGTFNTCTNAMPTDAPGWGLWEGIFFTSL